MPPAAGYEVHAPHLEQKSADISMPPATSPKPSRGTRLLIQVFKASAPITSPEECVLSTFVDDRVTLAELRNTLPEVAGSHGTRVLENADWNFMLAKEGPDRTLVYHVPKHVESKEHAVDFAPALILKLAKGKKTKEQEEDDMSVGFETDHIVVRDCASGKTSSEQVIVLRPDSNPRSKELCAKLRHSMRSVSALYDKEPKIPVYTLFTALASLKKQAGDCTQMQALVKLVEELQATDIEKMKQLKDEGCVTFDYLQHLFVPGAKVVTTRSGIQDMLVGGKVSSTRYGETWCGRFFEVKYEVIKSNGKKFYIDKECVRMPAFGGTKLISQLPIRLLAVDTEAVLTARGRKVAAYSIGHHYLDYGEGGNMIQMTWCGPRLTRAQGRVMIDAVTFASINPNSGMIRDSDSEDDALQVDEDKLYMCYPTLLGFSFVAKQWGEIDVGKVTEIAYDEDAFTSLVLAPEKKTLIHSLVTNYQTGFTDVISGKGGGCIFLLHGQPGTGKTLTAEAIAELLHRPLYSVSVGELGTNTTQLEASLRQILDVASVWNAVVLLDEADIFLEKRTEHDVERNAMVGVFLRLLEYHQGVLFLTTNRVKSFDSAFHSRISVALRYHDLDRTQRKQVWSTLLAAARIEDLDVEPFVGYELNGRQIKTAIRLAQALATEQGSKVQACHVQQTLVIAQQFAEDLCTVSA